MKRRDTFLLILVVIVFGFISFIVSSMVIKSTNQRSTKVPVAQPISSTFPDVQNDPTYQAFLNNGALDLTQPVQIGNSQNNTPFSP